jgi:hypothetical protein
MGTLRFRSGCPKSREPFVLWPDGDLSNPCPRVAHPGVVPLQRAPPGRRVGEFRPGAESQGQRSPRPAPGRPGSPAKPGTAAPAQHRSDGRGAHWACSEPARPGAEGGVPGGAGDTHRSPPCPLLLAVLRPPRNWWRTFFFPEAWWENLDFCVSRRTLFFASCYVIWDKRLTLSVPQIIQIAQAFFRVACRD